MALFWDSQVRWLELLFGHHQCRVSRRGLKDELLLHQGLKHHLGRPILPLREAYLRQNLAHQDDRVADHRRDTIDQGGVRQDRIRAGHLLSGDGGRPRDEGPEDDRNRAAQGCRPRGSARRG